MTRPLAASLRALAASLVEAVETRLALLGADVEVQGAWVARLVTQAAFAFALAILAIGALAGLVVLAFWEHRVAAAGGVALFLVLATVAMLARLAGSLRDRPAFFAGTLETLVEDRERLERGVGR